MMKKQTINKLALILLIVLIIFLIEILFLICLKYYKIKHPLGKICNGDCSGKAEIVEGRYLTALSFNDKTYVVIDYPILNTLGQDDFSIEMWFKTRENTIADLMLKGNNNGRWFSFTQRNKKYDNQLWSQFDDGTDHHTKFIKSTTNINDDRWHHGLVVYNREGNDWIIKIYLDDILEQEKRFNNYGLLNNSCPIVLGRAYGNCNPHNSIGFEYWGIIDEFKVYGNQSQGLLVYLNFDDYNRTKVLDSSGNKFHGEMFGTAKNLYY